MSTEIFPALAGLEYPVVRTPIFRTLTQASASGNENRAALQTYPRWQWTLSFNFLRDTGASEFRALVSFFLARQGSFDSFLFDDVDDNSVTAQPIGRGDGHTTLFQLVRTFGGFDEPVLAPNTVTQLTVGGIAKTRGTDFAVGSWENGTIGSGAISFTSAPANGADIMADFTYYWPVRFVADQYDFSKFMNRLWEQKKLDLVSLKSP
jgi:uncharacterized protein (TIGR02217 family)